MIPSRQGSRFFFALREGNPKSWPDNLPVVLYATRSTQSRMTGYSPFFMMFGRKPSDDLSLFMPTGSPGPHYETHTEYVEDLKHKIQRPHQFTRSSIDEAVVRQQRLYHRTAKIFAEGSTVMLFTPRLHQNESSKLNEGSTSDQRPGPSIYSDSVDEGCQDDKKSVRKHTTPKHDSSFDSSDSSVPDT
jgi:hypothetical protein